MTEQLEKFNGHCPVCDKDTTFVADGKWYRSTLKCPTCAGSSVPRERAIAHVINREVPNWRERAIHESSPAGRGISLKLRTECKTYVASQFFPGEARGATVKGWRNEDLEAQTFESGIFDLVVSLDVTEHVFNPDRLFREVHRTLKPGGLYISTFPIIKKQIEPFIPRARLHPNGEIEHLLPAQYHGNPVDAKGSLVTFDYGYGVHEAIAGWAPFDVEITRFYDRHIGVIGEYTEVVICRKRS